MRDPWLILISGITAAMLLGLQHYAGLPYWQSAQRRPMPVLTRYIIGVLGLLTPVAVVYLAWGEMTAADALAALVGTVIVGGGAVLAFYGLDRLFAAISLRHDRKNK